MKAAATYRDILGAGNFFLELQFQGIEEQKLVNNGLLPLARDLEMPLVCTNDVHYLRRDDYRPHDMLLCIGTGKTVNDAERMQYYGDQFYLKTPEEMARCSATCPRRCATPWRSPSAATSTCPTRARYLPNFQVPDGFTLDGYFEHMVRQGFDMRRAAAAGAEARPAPPPHDRRVPERGSSTRSTSSSGCSTPGTS